MQFFSWLLSGKRCLVIFRKKSVEIDVIFANNFIEIPKARIRDHVMSDDRVRDSVNKWLPETSVRIETRIGDGYSMNCWQVFEKNKNSMFSKTSGRLRGKNSILFLWNRRRLPRLKAAGMFTLLCGSQDGSTHKQGDISRADQPSSHITGE